MIYTLIQCHSYLPVFYNVVGLMSFLVVATVITTMNVINVYDVRLSECRRRKIKCDRPAFLHIRLHAE